MESLWPKFEDSPIEENNSIQILREQAKAIKADTESAVCATFSKMTYRSGPTSAMKALSIMVSSMSSETYEEVLDENLQGKEDVNDLFEKTRYKFEIYNDEYRFRLFIVNYSILFPISLDVDGGILEDITYQNKTDINSNDELKGVLKDIFSSAKVRTVVGRMLQKKTS